MKDFIEVTSITGKIWLIRISEIAYITKRTSATKEETLELNLTEELSDFTIISLIHCNKDLWSIEPYEQIVKKIQTEE